LIWLNSNDHFLKLTLLCFTISIVVTHSFRVAHTNSSLLFALALLLTTPNIIGESNGRPGAILGLLAAVFSIVLLFSNSEGLNLKPLLPLIAMGLYWFVNTDRIATAGAMLFYLTLPATAMFTTLRTRANIRSVGLLISVAVATANLLYILDFALRSVLNEPLIYISGAPYGRIRFSYGGWSLGSITGGGSSLLPKLPRLVGWCGEPGLWACLSLTAFILIMLNRTTSRRFDSVIIIGSFGGILLSQSSGMILLFLVSVILTTIFSSKLHYVTRATTSLTFLGFFTLVSAKLRNSKVLAGEASSLTDRGFTASSLSGNFAQGSERINLLATITLDQFSGWVLLGAFLYFVFASRASQLGLLYATTMFLMALAVQPLQYHIGLISMMCLVLVTVLTEEKITFSDTSTD
jgi:hypothetical protein